MPDDVYAATRDRVNAVTSRGAKGLAGVLHDVIRSNAFLISALISTGRMSNYEPTARRPIANVFRLTANRATQICIACGISPDAISCTSIVFATAAALCFWQSRSHPSLLLIAPAFCYLRLWCNMLDGMVAIASGKASPRGEILNDLPDRISDVVIFAGAAHSGWMHPLIGYWAAIFAVLTAYVGVLGQTVGSAREFGGVMSKPWRMVMLHIGAWATFALSRRGQINYGSLSVLDWSCLVVIAGCLQTIAVRLRSTFRRLRTKSNAR